MSAKTAAQSRDNEAAMRRVRSNLTVGAILIKVMSFVLMCATSSV
jgi:hypothetical protein